MDHLRLQLSEQIKTAQEADLKSVLLAWIDAHNNEEGIRELHQAFGTHDGGWDTIDKLVGSIHAPSDWASEHNHYLYATPKTSTSA